MKAIALLCLLTLVPCAHASERGLGSWILNPNPAPLPHHRGFATCTYGDIVYMFGGDSTGASSGHMDFVAFATVQPDRSLGTWTETTSLPRSVWMPEAVQYGDYVYILGGYANGGTSATYMAEIQPDNTLGAWVPQSSLPSPVYGHTSARNGNRIYVLGNWRDNAVYHAEILSAGDLGPWQVATPLPEDLYAADAAVYDGKLFVFGGKEIIGTVQTIVPHVRYAEIQPDGSLGTWITTDALPAERWFHQVEVYDDRVFVVGGGGSASPTEDVAEGQIMPDGSIVWSIVSQVPNPSKGNGLAQVGGYFYYMVGEWDNEVYYAEIQLSSAVDPATPQWCQLEVWPNPCHATVVSRFNLPHREHVRIAVWDSNGREIVLLADHDMAPGNHWLRWNGLNRAGEKVPSGIYQLQLDGQSLRGSSRVLFIR